ncbi:MAG TPA: hypothetical protein VMZ66_11810 [Aeromicrobium sp.]|nr:hypothetical protein [Aeromicrobium sp.]
MRRIVRTVAAGIVIILGLALVSVAAFSSDIATATLPDAPTTASEGGEVAPLDPYADNGPVRKTKTPDGPDVFGTEFGRRGKHEVTVTISGSGNFHYQVRWRGGKLDDSSGQYSRTKTVKGGFPLVLVGITSTGPAVSCSITIDGIRKDTQTTTADTPETFCEG